MTTINPTAAPIETHVFRTTVALTELQPGDVLIDEPGAPEVTSAAATGEVLGTTRDGEQWSAVFDVDESHLRIDRTIVAMPTADELRELREQGMTLDAIGERYGISAGEAYTILAADRKLVEPSPHRSDLEQSYRHALDAAAVLVAERRRLQNLRTDLARVHSLAGFGFRKATSVRLNDANLSIDAIDRALAALRGDA